MRTCILLIALILSPLSVMASDDGVDCSVRDFTGQTFSDVYKLAKTSAHVLCTSWIEEKALSGSAFSAQQSLVDFGQLSLRAIHKAGLNNGTFDTEMAKVIQTFGNFGPPDSSLPELRLDTFGNDSVHFDGIKNPVDLALSTVDCSFAHTSCKKTFQDLADAFNAYRDPYNNFVNTGNKALVDALGIQWDRFLDVAKSQTALEVILTTTLQGNHFKQDHLVGPPGYEVIALHPQIVYDTLTDDNTDRSKLGVAVEWVGVNYWDWKIPFGISFASVYANRDGVRDSRNGFMLHLDNKYAIGWVRGGGNSSVFFTIDLLKLVSSKKATLEQYLK